MMRTALLLLVAVAGLVGLAACTTISPEVCQAGDWESIGVADGADGSKSGVFLDHQRACAKVGVVADEAAWRKGYDTGLMAYCQPKTVYKAGKIGISFPEVCERFKTEELQFAYDFGRRYWDIDRELVWARMDLREARETAAVGGTVIASDRVNLGINVTNLRLEQSKYSRWPPPGYVPGATQ